MNHCINSFSSSLGSSHQTLSSQSIADIHRFVRRKCSPSLKRFLEAPVSAQDIESALFNLPRSKAPGADGYTVEFFMHLWDTIGYDFTLAVQEFFSTAKLLKQLNTTVLCLIPKRSNAERVSDFRPISLCNVMYKVISRILASRLQQAVLELVSGAQSAFIKGRLMIENVMLASEMVQGFQSRNISPRGLLKVDLRKAFDSLNWQFVVEMLRAAEFPPLFIEYIQQCVTTVSFSLEINGERCGFFKGGKGIRQGDAISPYLFVLAMELLGNCLDNEFTSGSVGYHPKARDMRISHIAFADDLMIFFDGRPSSLQAIIKCMDHFHTISGLVMNRDKSSVFFAGLSHQEAILISEFGFHLGSFPIRYLGLPLLCRKLRARDYQPLIDSLLRRFNGWADKVLSFSGRLQLISSVIYGTINFWMSAFVLPRECIRQIERLCSRFLWNGNTRKKGGIKVSWSKVCLPKEEGGLGLREMITWNKVLILKLIWLQFISAGSLWVAWLKNYYYPSSSFWDARSLPSSWWIWRLLQSMKDLARQFIRVEVGNGSRTYFWFDHWCRLGPLILLFGDQGPRELGVPREATIAEVRVNNGWRIRPARSENALLLHFELAQLDLTFEPNRLDRFLWCFQQPANSSDRFSSSLTWNHLRPRGQIQPWRDLIWFSGHIPRHAFNLWVANLNKLPLKVRLHRWGLSENKACCLCNSEDETRDHLFGRCSFTAQVWSLVFHRLGLPPAWPMTWASLLHLMGSAVSSPSILVKLSFQASIYGIWQERNGRLHGLPNNSPEITFRRIDRWLRDKFLANQESRTFHNLYMEWVKNTLT